MYRQIIEVAMNYNSHGIMLGMYHEITSPLEA